MSDEEKKPEPPTLGQVWKWLQVIAIGVAAIAAAVVHLEAKAQDAGTQAAAPAVIRTEATARELERFEREGAARFDRLEAQGNSTQLKVDAVARQNEELKLQMAALLERFRIPNPAPADAGR